LKAEADQARLMEECEESCKKVEENLQLLREETLKERDLLQKEADDTHHPLEEALRQQEQLRKLNEDMQQHIAQGGYRRSSRNNAEVTDTQPLSNDIMGEPIP